MADLGDYGGTSGFGGGVASGSDVGTTGPDSSGDFGFFDFGGYTTDPGFGFDANLGAFDVSSPSYDYSNPIGQPEEEEDVFGFVDRALKSKPGQLAQTALNFTSPLVGKTLGMLGKGIDLGRNPNANQSAGKYYGGTAGGLFGGMLGGPLGAFAGSQIGNFFGGKALEGVTANKGVTGMHAPQGSNTMDFIDKMVPTLGALYTGMQGNRGLSGQIGNLENMYGQNSPYSQALRQQLERRDAASGRRSQYGAREVELQAQLANAASGNARGLASLYGQKNAQQAKLLQALMAGYQQMGGLKGITSGLSGLFGGGEEPSLGLSELYDAPEFPSFNWGG